MTASAGTAKQPSTIGIVNYGAGNIFSLTAALERQGLSFGMVNTEEDFSNFERIIIPGVGHAGAAMGKLRATGMVNAIKKLKKPVLGICLGMQLMTKYSSEGEADLLNIMPLETAGFSGRIPYKVPHMGWSRIEVEKQQPLFSGIPNGTPFYFVHSYFIEYHSGFTAASCTYGVKFSAAIQHYNFYGVQFHPEKSGSAGELLLKNFSTF